MKTTTKFLPTPVKVDSRICFGINYYTSEAAALVADAAIRHRGDTYNGGFYHGMPCGRDKSFDYTDPVFGPLFAVTTA